MTPETIPLWRSIAGGALIGAAAAALILLNGRIAGVSGILDSAVRGQGGEQGWRVAFLAGLILPALVVGTGPVDWAGGPVRLALAGLLVGIGTRLGSGCTSGHGVCGIANLSLRSLAATSTFVAIAMATVALLRFGGEL